MQLVHRRDVRQHRSYGVTMADIAAHQKRGKTPAARIGLRPGEGAALVDGADMIGIDRSGARQETQRSQGDEVCWCLVQADIVLALLPAHRQSPSRSDWIPIDSHGNIATTIRPTSSAR